MAYMVRPLSGKNEEVGGWRRGGASSYSDRLCILVLNEDFIASGPSCH